MSDASALDNTCFILKISASHDSTILVVDGEVGVGDVVQNLQTNEEVIVTSVDIFFGQAIVKVNRGHRQTIPKGMSKDDVLMRISTGAHDV
jgi:hypothetical protein